MLDIARQLCEYQLGPQSDGEQFRLLSSILNLSKELGFILASIDLAHEYVLIGKTRRARNIFNRVLNSVEGGRASDEVSVAFFLRYAELLALSEDIPRR
jgi:separase